MERIDKHAVAARLRSLMRGSISQVARWLHVSEAAIRAAIRDVAPRPTMDVVVAAAIHYGVDPAWILVEGYDPDALRAAADGNLNEATAAVVRILLRSAPEVDRDWLVDEMPSPAEETVADLSHVEQIRRTGDGTERGRSPRGIGGSDDDRRAGR